MRDRFTWTDFEEGILIDAVREAKSVKVGLQNAADVLNTTFYICRNRWYMQTQPKLNEQEVIFREAEVVDDTTNDVVDVVDNLKDSLEGFLGNLSRVVTENARLTEENFALKRDNNLLTDELKELKESYNYILKVMDKARKLCLQDEDKPKSVKYQIKDGAIEFTA